MSPWVEKIMAGEKTWEIRSKATRVRGPIALIRKGSGKVVGVCELADCVGPLRAEEFARHFNKHRVPSSTMAELGYERVYAWVLRGAKPLTPAAPYAHPSGAVIWVTLDGMPADAAAASAAASL